MYAVATFTRCFFRWKGLCHSPKAISCKSVNKTNEFPTLSLFNYYIVDLQQGPFSKIYSLFLIA